MEVRLREATPADVPSLEIVRSQAIEHGFAGEYDRAAVADLVASADPDLGDWIDSEEHLVVVVESEVTILAYGVLDRGAGAVRGVYTAPAYEREGWGSRVLDRFEELAREANIEALEAAVPHNAVAFFEANGYERLGEVEEDGLALVEMRRTVRPQA